MFYVAWASRAIPECPLLEGFGGSSADPPAAAHNLPARGADGAGEPHLYSPLASSHGLPFG